jgi:Tol biopolymer transport system component
LRGSPAWAPDGQSIACAVNQGGTPRLFRFSPNGDAPVLLVSEYSIDPVWSPDGRFLVFSGPDVGTTFPLRAAAADGRVHPLRSLILTRGARRVSFLRDPHSLVILRGEIGNKNLWLVDLETGIERQLTSLSRNFVIRDFDISGDGREIVFDRVQENSDLVLIDRVRH